MTIYFNLPTENLIKLHGEHSPSLVALSIVVICIASYAALAMNKKVYKNNFFHKNVWFFHAAIIMGTGIWAMHFIGMSAYLLPITVKYNWFLTTISILPAMSASFFAFYIAGLPKRTLNLYIIAGFIMGIGISAMHYLSMLAIEIDGHIIYNAWGFVASIVVSIVVSFVALYVFSTLREYMENHFIHFSTSIILGLAVSSMHYTGMMAITFYVAPNYPFETVELTDGVDALLIFSLIFGMSILFGLLIFSSLIDRYIKYQTKFYDSLTRLPNRRLFEKDLKASTEKRTLAIWHLHNLEKVNREKGYMFGDQVIQKIATILLSLKPAHAQLYRVEGHRFALLTDAADNDQPLHNTLRETASILRRPITITPEEEVTIPAVCAWQEATSPIDITNIYTDVLAVLNDSRLQYKYETIRYDAKVHTYTFEQEIVSDISRAMENDELFLVYQPKINGLTHEITGVEALLRWNHPTYGFLSPAVFIPVLETNDKMLEVTDWIINKACQQLDLWRNDDYIIEQISINIPGTYVTSPRLLKALKRAVHQYHLKPSNLELEITETSFVQAINEAIEAVAILRQEGFSVALDDFGTGVSSLSYLKRIPISTLKIDKSFVDGVPASPTDSSIIQAIIALATSLKLGIVFEGVETEEQVAFLTSTCEVPIIQGYCFAKPMLPSEIKEWSTTFRAEYVH